MYHVMYVFYAFIVYVRMWLMCATLRMYDMCECYVCIYVICVMRVFYVCMLWVCVCSVCTLCALRVYGFACNDM